MTERNRLLIDKSGRVSSPQSRLSTGIHMWEPGDENVFAFAIRNLGFVGIELGASYARIWLAEATAVPRAVLTARDMLRRYRPFRTVLTTIGRDGERNRLVSGWQGACSALLSAASKVQVPHPDAHRSQVRNVDAVRKFPILEHAYRSWTANANLSLVDHLLPVLERTPNVRFVLAEHAKEEGTSVIRKMGGAFTAYEKTWLQMAGGLRVQDQPDYAYGMWIARTYAGVASSGTALIDVVDVEVVRPRVGLIRSRYQRLVLPVAARRPDKLNLLSLNILDRTIDLRSL